MKGLTLWQPWASLIAIEAKPYEFRSWPAPGLIVGQRIAIHAGARPVRRNEVADLIVRLRSDRAWSTALVRDIALPFLEAVHATPGSIPLSAVVATAVCGMAVPGSSVVTEFEGFVNDSDRDGAANWAWPMRDVRAVVPAIPYRGFQGIWNLETDLEADQ